MFHNIRPNEMILGVYGYDGQSATISHMWPDVEGKPGLETKVSFKFNDAETVDLPLDHFTFHADGTFHAKVSDSDSIYQYEVPLENPITSSSPPFLYALVLTNRAEKYQIVDEQVKFPHMWIGQKELETSLIKAIFYGSDYPLNLIKHVPKGEGSTGAITWKSSTINGVIYSKMTDMPDNVYQNHPGGTIITFRFPLSKDRWLLKTFALK